ncbi:hypothetical protein Ahy_A02g007538 [Arachis hypogaea]|uniref:NB-ARC domain-containing protein n=1 Tax=Arachis hypogaea TaxID=3818 RepID=A0A445ED43_ARAHY|nr:hypothetical protein Ahy_A02g007538 [Arachis hypogaea]
MGMGAIRKTTLAQLIYHDGKVKLNFDFRGTPLHEMPKGMRKLKSLQFLSSYIVGKCEENKIKELGALANLHESISITKLKNVVDSSKALEARMKASRGVDGGGHYAHVTDLHVTFIHHRLFLSHIVFSESYSCITSKVDDIKLQKIRIPNGWATSVTPGKRNGEERTRRSEGKEEEEKGGNRAAATAQLSLSPPSHRAVAKWPCMTSRAAAVVQPAPSPPSCCHCCCERTETREGGRR